MTNVGEARCTYQALVVPPSGIEVTVVPKVLAFMRYGKKISFTMNFKPVMPTKDYVFGSLTQRSARRTQLTNPLVVRVASGSGL